MSDVISFRLNKENQREAKALEVLNAWIEKGFSTRHILTTALLELDHPGSEPAKGEDGCGMELVLNQIGLLLEILKDRETNPGVRQDPDKEPYARGSIKIKIDFPL